MDGEGMGMLLMAVVVDHLYMVTEDEDEESWHNTGSWQGQQRATVGPHNRSRHPNRGQCTNHMTRMAPDESDW